jgi:hypothetical protein
MPIAGNYSAQNSVKFQQSTSLCGILADRGEALGILAVEGAGFVHVQKIVHP